MQASFVNLRHLQNALREDLVDILRGAGKADQPTYESHINQRMRKNTKFSRSKFVIDCSIVKDVLEIITPKQNEEVEPRFKGYLEFLLKIELSETNDNFKYVFGTASPTKIDGNFFSHCFLPDMMLYVEAIQTYADGTEKDIAQIGLVAVNDYKSLAVRGKSLAITAEGTIVAATVEHKVTKLPVNADAPFSEKARGSSCYLRGSIHFPSARYYRRSRHRCSQYSKHLRRFRQRWPRRRFLRSHRWRGSSQCMECAVKLASRLR